MAHQEIGITGLLKNKKTREALVELVKILSERKGGGLTQGYSPDGIADLNAVSFLQCDGGYREVVAIARSLRVIEYELLMLPEERMLPQRFQDEIDTFINSIIENPSVGKEIVNKEQGAHSNCVNDANRETSPRREGRI